MNLNLINPNFSPDVPPPEEQIKAEMMRRGFPGIHVIRDGKMHRFATSEKKGDDAGWYIFFDDQIPAGMFGDWRRGVEYPFCCTIGRELSADEIAAHNRAMAEAKQARDDERAALAEDAKRRAAEILAASLPATPDHPYLARKKVMAFDGIRVTDKGAIAIPVRDYTGQLSSLQFINADGEKKFLYGGEVKNRFFLIGAPGTKIFLCEGYATGATIHAATGCAVLVCFSASNLPNVARLVRTRFGSVEIVIAADNDENGIGKKYADEAAGHVGATVVLPPEVGQDVNDFANAGGDVAALLCPAKKAWLVPADDFANQPVPIKWLIKNWIPENSTVMLHGPSGSGKTFLVLDMAAHIASGKTTWCGSKVRSAPVVYLCGEGHAGLRARLAAWKQYYGPDPICMWIAQSALDLDTDEGRQTALEQIRSLPERPALIIVDTLHRYLSGDENKSQDARTMLASCDKLREEFKATVLYVHHTGIADDAKHRARGSSAWRGALDIEISVKGPSKGGCTMTIEQMKNKDGATVESLYMERTEITIAGWCDDDGEAVTSLILMQGRKPEPKPTQQKDNPVSRIENAWRAYSREYTPEGLPKIDRAHIKQHLIDLGMSESSAHQYAYRTSGSRLVAQLLADGVLSSYDSETLLIVDPAAALRLKNL